MKHSIQPYIILLSLVIGLSYSEVMVADHLEEYIHNSHPVMSTETDESDADNNPITHDTDDAPPVISNANYALKEALESEEYGGDIENPQKYYPYAGIANPSENPKSLPQETTYPTYKHEYYKSLGHK